MNDLTGIGNILHLPPASPATAPPGPSLTWIKEDRICQCGTTFTARSEASVLCRNCAIKERDAEELHQLQERLPDAIQEARSQWRHEDSNLPVKFQSSTFATFDSSLQPKAWATVQGWDGTHSIVLISPGVYGIGKTHLAAALVNQIIDSRPAASIIYGPRIAKLACPVYFITETKLLGRIRATYNDGAEETESAVFEALAEPDLLVIDDVGKVKPRDYAFLQRVYFEIIDGRYTSEWPIMLTSNLSWAELEAHIGGASADRLREMCGPDNLVKMTGKSYRLKGKTLTS